MKQRYFKYGGMQWIETIDAEGKKPWYIARGTVFPIYMIFCDGGLWCLKCGDSCHYCADLPHLFATVCNIETK